MFARCVFKTAELLGSVPLSVRVQYCLYHCKWLHKEPKNKLYKCSQILCSAFFMLFTCSLIAIKFFFIFSVFDWCKIWCTMLECELMDRYWSWINFSAESLHQYCPYYIHINMYIGEMFILFLVFIIWLLIHTFFNQNIYHSQVLDLLWLKLLHGGTLYNKDFMGNFACFGNWNRPNAQIAT